MHPQWNRCGVLGCPTGSLTCSYCTAWNPAIRDYACASCALHVDREGCTRLLRHIVHISKPRSWGPPVVLSNPHNNNEIAHIPPRPSDAPAMWDRPPLSEGTRRNVACLSLEDERKLPKRCGRSARNRSTDDGAPLDQGRFCICACAGHSGRGAFARPPIVSCINASRELELVPRPKRYRRGVGGNHRHGRSSYALFWH